MNNQRSATIELHIDELTLHGFPQLDRDQLDAAVRMELTRLLTERGVPAQLRQAVEVVALPANALTVASTASASTLGVRIAQAIYGGLAQ